MTHEPYWDLDQAAAYVNAHPESLRRACRIKKLRHGRLGHAFRFRREWLDEYLQGGK